MKKLFIFTILMLISLVLLIKTVAWYNEMTLYNLIFMAGTAILLLLFCLVWLHSEYHVSFDYAVSRNSTVVIPTVIVEETGVAIVIFNYGIGFRVKKQK